MTTKTPAPTLGHIPDDLWIRIAPVLGPENAPGPPGRRAVAFGRIFDGIVDVVRTGGQGPALPRQESAPGSTVQGRFRQGVKAGVVEKAGKVGLKYSDQELGSEGKGPALDGVSTKAPLGERRPAPVRWTAPKRALSAAGSRIGGEPLWPWGSPQPPPRTRQGPWRPGIA
jgi:transposase